MIWDTERTAKQLTLLPLLSQFRNRLFPFTNGINMFAAHVRKNGDIQSVEEHCQHTAKNTSVILSDHGLINTGYLAGLLHDMGKYTKAFHHYIIDSFNGKPVAKGSVVHTFAGFRLLLEMFHKNDGQSFSDISCELIAYAIGAHHELFDVVDENMNSGFQYRMEKHQEKAAFCFRLKLRIYNSLKTYRIGAWAFMACQRIDCQRIKPA